MPAIPAHVQTKFPGIRWDAEANTYTSTSPITDWNGFHAAMKPLTQASQFRFTNGAAPATAGITPASQNKYGATEVLKSPAVAQMATDLEKSWKESSEALNLTNMLNELKGATAGLKTAYADQNKALDIGGYAATQRALDAEAAAKTGEYSQTARGIGDQYRENDANYETKLNDIVGKAYDILPQYDAAARAIGDEQLGQMMGSVNRRRFTTGGNLGVSSGELKGIARGVANVELPLAQQKIQRQYDVLTGLEKPAAGELANRATARLAQFDLPMERDIYQQVYQDTMQKKQTEQQIQQLAMTVSGMEVQAAESYLRSLALPAELIASVMRNKLSTAGGIGQLEDSAYYRGLEYLPGVNPTQPQYFSNALPPYPGAPQRNSGGGGGVNMNALTEAMPSGPAYRSPEWYRQQKDANGQQKYSDQMINQWAGGEGYKVNPALTGSFWTDSYNRGRTPQEEALFRAVQSQYQ